MSLDLRLSPLRFFVCLTIVVSLSIAGDSKADAVSEDGLIETVRAGGPAAENAAEWLSGMESAKGLTAIIATKNQELVRSYIHGFPRYTYPAPEFPFVDDRLNPELEKIVLQTVEEWPLGKVVLQLAQSRKYQTKTLFEVLLRYVTDGPDSDLGSAAIHTITNTDLPNIEQPLLSALPSLTAQQQRTLLSYWRDRQYPASALPVLKSIIAKSTGPVDAQLYAAIAKVESPEAVEFLVGEIEKPRAGTPRRAELINYLALMPGTVPVPVDRVIAAMPPNPDENESSPYISLLGERRAEGGVDYLLAYFEKGRTPPYALHALKLMPPSAWPRIRTGLKRLLDEKRITEEYRVQHAQVFWEQLGNPERYRQRQAMLFREIEAQRLERELDRRYSRKLDQLQKLDADKYEQAFAIYEKMKENLIDQIGVDRSIGAGAKASSSPPSE